ncbi:mandelate racemase/muconate lactonizing enzyme family protein [Rhizobium sp. BK376]|uniref:mandelate racemase/muconate lactonizing enzyme family protein n=1 Tax=Rhizobium sp. BK376 TaxID=2512149 RepID=UPI0010515E3E|nr:mandelate racemase/muconate lactonizing enzyme family protein [Rhizobium sp. BK376]TCR70706.1 L-alanine-DL-glutamate epimerase-like enolase superfamily enzyme [Rhizobium sp. BK376]
MKISAFRITRFQFARDRVIGDSQVRADDANVAALELVSDSGEIGLGFIQTLFSPLPDQAEIERIFAAEVWPGLEGQRAIALVHRVNRPRGGNQRATSLPFHEALQVALWDLAAKETGLPLHRLLGSRRDRVKAYASGLDFHLSDDDYQALFAHASEIGYRAFKIKVGHPDFERDLHRLKLLQQVIPVGSEVMIDANEGWSSKEALMKLEAIRRAGHDLLWVEDPILRHDYEGLRTLRHAASWTQINSGEYLDLQGKRLLLEAHGTDILNVHGQVSDVMRIGWLTADMGIPVSLGNTFLEIGVHMAVALPEVEWLEYSFQNFDHLVDEPIEIRDGYAYAPDRPGHGLVLSETARRDWARPVLLPRDQLGEAPANPRLGVVT